MGNRAMPRVNRVEFYRKHEGEFAALLAGAIRQFLVAHDEAELTNGQLVLSCWGQVVVDVPNGGFEQFFYNFKGADEGTEALCALLDEVDAPKAAAALREALGVYRRNAEAFEVENPWEAKLFGRFKEFRKLERTLSTQVLKAMRQVESWARENIGDIAVGDDGQAIDPTLTGAVESFHPNGIVAERIELKDGRPHGAYRRFFDDGTVGHVQFYKRGEVSGDYWPSGQLRKKQSKRGTQTLLEWYYPSGRLQKRLVAEKTGYPAEPVRLYYENRQLAEEMTAPGGKRRGPWVKFFEDGSPKLQAEFARDRELRVHNAWDDDRQQVVTDGTGTFVDDGRDPVTRFNLWSVLLYRDVIEFRDGVRHGTTTRYLQGVLWEVTRYEMGRRNGEQVQYWDNGRVREVTAYEQDRPVGEARSFPKFDRPVPAVRVSVRADEELYDRWKRMPLSEYPQPLNLEEIQGETTVPQFLLDVAERNRAGALKDDYENWNTFDDGITYFIEIDADGRVSNVKANGSGIYSGGQWETYKPLLARLRFAPGRIGGKAVPCKVLANVAHTFAESGA